MKSLKFFSFLFVILPLTAGAAALCPANSCNPANGCMDGCSQEQVVCAYNSVPQCVGQEIHSSCVRKINANTAQETSVNGYCRPLSTALPAACACH